MYFAPEPVKVWSERTFKRGGPRCTYQAQMHFSPEQAGIRDGICGAYHKNESDISRRQTNAQGRTSNGVTRCFTQL